LKCYNFLWVQRRHNRSPAASFANCVMTLNLFKVHLQTFLSIPINLKCQILSCDTLVANGGYVLVYLLHITAGLSAPAFRSSHYSSHFHHIGHYVIWYTAGLYLNKQHICSLTQRRLILIQMVTVYLNATCFGLYLGHPKACKFKKNFTKEDTIKKCKGHLFLQSLFL
jgi:hypothetical protein